MLRPTSVTFGSGRKLNPAWPITVPLVGLPIWWVLGVWQLMFIAMAVPMAVYLLRQRSIAMPRGFGAWLVWLAWLLTGLFVLQVDAPYAVPGANMNRYLVFAFRYAWYLVATIAVLYVVNTRHILSSQKIVQAVAWFFVWLVAGGLLGLFAPGIDLPSVLQALLPHSLASNPFVNGLMRIQSAQLQDVIGSQQPRPSAPFIYTNEWGGAIALVLPFFVAAWWVRSRNWRIAMVVTLALALVVIVASLNRGVWVALLAAAALVVVQTAIRGRPRVLAVALALIGVVAVVVLVSPLDDIVTARLDNGHSDDVRSNLALTAVDSTAQGSPVVGFGTTRDVAGTFNSIAGGASDACPRCYAPPLGTHGQLWLVTFGAGFVGALLYVGFVSGQFVRSLRARAPYAMAASAALLVLLISSLFYTAVGIPLYLGMIAVGLIARESRLPLPALEEAMRPVMRHFAALIAMVLVGALAGQGFHLLAGTPHLATQKVLVPATELVPVPGARVSTLDSEATLVQSSAVIDAVADALEVPFDVARAGLRVGAEPNTRVLVVSYEADSPGTATRGVEAAVEAYLREREVLLGASSDLIRERYEAFQSDLDATYRSTRSLARSGSGSHLWDTLYGIEQQWASAAGVLMGLHAVPQARAIASPTVSVLQSSRVVRISTGAAIGLLVGLALVQAYDRRYLRLGNRPVGRLGGRVPIVAVLSDDDGSEMAKVVRSYAPVAGVLAGPGGRESLAMATRLDRELSPESWGGRRSLIVVDRGSRVGRIRNMIQEVTRMGMEPVGLVIRERTAGPLTRGKRAK